MARGDPVTTARQQILTVSTVVQETNDNVHYSQLTELV